MVKPISRELREKLLQQRREMTPQSIIIPLKDFSKMRIRLLPCESDLPGVRVTSYYCPSLNERKGTISPATFGKKCPIAHAMEKIRRSGDKDDIERAKQHVREIVEYYLPVIDRGDDDESGPRIRVFPAKKTVYMQIQNRLLDEDLNDNITDVDEGRDILIKKEGSGLTTEWKAVFLDTSPLHPNAAVKKSIEKAAETFNIWDHVYKPDYDVLAQIYRGLADEEMPDSFRDSVSSTGAAATKAKSKASSDDESEDVEEPKPAPRARAKAPAFAVGNIVSFESEGQLYEGEVSQISDDGTVVVVVDDEEWDVNAKNLTLVAEKREEEEADEEEEDAEETEGDDEEAEEAEEAPPVVSRRKQDDDEDATPRPKVSRKPAPKSASAQIASKKKTK